MVWFASVDPVMAFSTTDVMTPPAPQPPPHPSFLHPAATFFPIVCVTVSPSLPCGPTIALLIAGHHFERRSVPRDAPCGRQAIKWQINTLDRRIFVLPAPCINTLPLYAFLSRGGQQGRHALHGAAADWKVHLCGGEASALPMRPLFVSVFILIIRSK